MTTRQQHRITTAPQLGELLTTKAVARRIGVAEVTLIDWRHRRWPGGPQWLKVGRLVKYPANLLEQWIAERLQGAA